MQPHAPTSHHRPPDLSENDPPLTNYNPIEQIPKPLTTDAIIEDLRLDYTVKKMGQESPSSATANTGLNRHVLNRGIVSSLLQTHTQEVSDQSKSSPESTNSRDFGQKSPTPEKCISGPNCEIPIRGINSNAPKTSNPTISGHVDTPVATSDSLELSGKLSTGEDNAPAAKIPQIECQTAYQGQQVDFPPLTSNFIQPIRFHRKSNDTVKVLQPPVRQNASEGPQPFFPSIDQLNAKFNHQPTHKNHHNAKMAGNPSSRFPSQVNASIPAPQPPNVIPSYATRLRASQIHDEQKIELSPPTITTKQGLPAVLFKREDFMVKLADKCKFTVIGKFSNTMPKMEVIRRSLTSQLQIKGTCKVTHFNYKHVYIDLDNELDHTTVWNKEKIWVQGMQMRLFVWTPTFKPQEETPVAPVWVILPELPWHCYRMEFVSRLLAPIGRVLFFDAASLQKTRGSVAKVKIEIDITKPRVHHVWMGFPEEDDDVFGDGKWQEIQFEHVPEYCGYCKHQGHADHACIIKRREEDQSRRKEEQSEKKKERAENPDLQMQGNSQAGFDKVQSSKQVPKETTKQPLQGKNQWQTQKRKGARVTNNQEITKRQAEEGQTQEINHSKKKQAVRGNPPVQKEQYVAKNTEQVHTQKNSKGGEDLVTLGICMDYPAVKPHDLTVHKLVDDGFTEWHSQNAFDVLAGTDNNAEPTLILNSAGAISDANRGTQQIAATDCGEPDMQGQMLGFSTAAYLQDHCCVSSGMHATVSTPPCDSGAVQLSKSLGDVVATVNQQRLLLDIPIAQTATVPRTAEHMQTFAPSQNCAAKDSNSAPLSEKKEAQQMKNSIGPDDVYVTEIREFNSVPRLCTKVQCTASLRDAIVHHCVDGENRQQSKKIDDVRNSTEQCAPNLIPENEQNNVKKQEMEKISVSTKDWVLKSFETMPDTAATCARTHHSNSKSVPSDKSTKPEQLHAAELHASSVPIGNATGKKSSKKKTGKKSTPVTKDETAGEQIQEKQTEEEVRKAKIRAWQDAILAKSYAENPVIENITEPLNVLENKATNSVPSQDSFDPSNAITMGRDNDDIENDRALTAYVSPAHSGNTLIPTATLEVMCKQASKVMKEVGRGFFPVTPQDRIDTETQEAPTYYLGNLFEESQKDQRKLSKEVKSNWNLDAPLFIPNALRQQETQVPVESVDSQDASAHEFTTGPSDEVLLQRMDLHDIRGLLHRQNSPPHDLPQKFSSPHPGIIEDGSEYEDEDEDSTAYNKMAEARYAGLSPRFEQAVKPKLIKKKRRPLEIPKKKEAAPKKPKRVQPTRSSKSRSSRRK